MSAFQSPRGTRDILPAEQRLWEEVLATARQVAAQMGYQPFSTPMYEEVGVFQRSLGKGTDIMDKELFLISSRHGEEATYALRPEGTAGIVRAFIQHGMQTWPQPVRLTTVTQLFRYERPQHGRYREHVQVNFDTYGDQSAFADAWVILTMWRTLQALGLSTVKLLINSLGTQEERADYCKLLVSSLTPHHEKLSEDSKRRLELNPLRILDSKDENDQALLREIPHLIDSLTPESRTRFDTVTSYLTAWGIPFELEPRLVRGLDYYCHTAFEWVATQGSLSLSLGGGGRYDGLLPELGGPDIGAIGMGMGVDRVVQILQELRGETATLQPEVWIVAQEQKAQQYAAGLIQELLERNLRVQADFGRPSFGAQLKAAGRSGAKVALLLGLDEVNAATVTIKDLTSGEQRTIGRAEVGESIANLCQTT